MIYDGGLTRKRLVRLGFVFEPWQTAQYVENPSIGRFEGDSFDPPGWRPRVGTAAFFPLGTSTGTSSPLSAPGADRSLTVA